MTRPEEEKHPDPGGSLSGLWRDPNTPRMSDEEAIAEMARRRAGNDTGNDPDTVNDDVDGRELDAILGNPAEPD